MTQWDHPQGHSGGVKPKKLLFKQKMPQKYRFYSRTNMFSHCILEEYDVGYNLVSNMTQWDHPQGHSGGVKPKKTAF